MCCAIVRGKKGLIYCVPRKPSENFLKIRKLSQCHPCADEHKTIGIRASAHTDAIQCLDDNQLVRTQTNNLKGYLSKKKKNRKRGIRVIA